MNLTYYYLENTNDSSYKFYLAAYDDQGHAYYRWGKIGTKGQERVITGNASDVRRKASDKRSGGYSLLADAMEHAAVPGEPWDYPFWKNYSSASPAQTKGERVALVHCSSCQEPGYELTGWIVLSEPAGDSLVCPVCQNNGATSVEDRAAALLASLEAS